MAACSGLCKVLSAKDKKDPGKEDKMSSSQDVTQIKASWDVMINGKNQGTYKQMGEKKTFTLFEIPNVIVV